MLFKKSILLYTLLIAAFGFSQPELSSSSTISILTVGTADELHSKFGHSAIRVQDAVLGIDVVYNYGFFDFSTPNFYVKFTRGKLLYRLVRERFSDFLYGYELENRWVREQELDLSTDQKNELLKFLEVNYLPENRYYKYDFLFDNCSTRLPDALKSVLKEDLVFDYSHIQNRYTFRELIHQNLEVNSWSNFGIDLALGSVIDREAMPYEQLFLPIYVYQQLPYNTLNSKKLVTKDTLLLDEKPTETKANFLLSPLFWLTILGVIILFVTYKDYKHKTRARWLDFALFFITGLAGILILFLWLGTDHKATANNYNFLWSFPLNIIIAFLLVKKGTIANWISKYLLLLIGFLALTLIIWVFKVQVFSPLIVLIIVPLALRYLFLIYSQRSG
ncbi:MAG: DUF4105 domain-containing protein [Cellulophaga sp.]|nr:DUF4105 domain-containing protein [Cellulophaga sp.]